LTDLVEQHAAEIGVISSLENGIPAHLYAGSMAPIVSGWLRYYAGYADKLEGITSAHWPSEQFEYSIPEPFGVIGIIIPWNAPMISLAQKVGPAVAAGCTVVVKPHETTPYTALRFGQLALEAGIPPGVINVVPGTAVAGMALVAHPGVDKISFTGGTVAARKIHAACAESLKPALYELGGKSANIIFADADLDRAIPYSAAFPMINAGQGCQLPTRLLVERSIYDTVLERAVSTIRALTVGDPLAETTYMGPVASQASVTRILSDIRTANDSKAGRMLVGGNRMGGDLANGYFIEPTVFADVDPKSRLAQQEIFGPVLSIFPFKDEAEAIALANSTAWGLAGYIQTRDLSRAHRVAAQMVCGNVYINGARNVHPAAPFGGVGLSGFGKEGGRWGIEEFIRQKSVGIELR
jgi:aldehyde dehydrogenase (NAD+)